MRWFALFCGLLAAASAFAQAATAEPEATPDELRRDAAAFAGLDQEIREQLADVQAGPADVEARHQGGKGGLCLGADPEEGQRRDGEGSRDTDQGG